MKLLCCRIAAVCFAAMLTPIASAAVLQGLYSDGFVPGVQISWSSDFGPDPSAILWASGPHTGFHEVFIQGTGPGPASAYLSVDCPGPQTTPGDPTIVRNVTTASNFDGIYGLSADCGMAETLFLLDQSYPTLHYRIEWSFQYENFAGVNGAGEITLRHGMYPNPSQVVTVFSGTFGTLRQSGVITGTGSGDRLWCNFYSNLYQGQGVPGSGRLTAETRMWVDTQPIAPPPCAGDANADGSVTFSDVTNVLANFGTSYAPGTGPGDADRNGVVNFADITNVLAHFNEICT